MCGIAGVFGDAIDEIWTSKQLEVLARRGPDSKGQLRAGAYCELVACRLAMTDPNPRSNQPFVDSFSNNVIVFNGEVYNYRELRDELIVTFPMENFCTESDTEVLLRWLDKYGVSGISRLQGMFSFAYFNKTRSELMLSRDSLGKKPLYWMRYNNSVYWSSSMKSFSMLSEGFISADAQIQYLALGYVLDPNSILRGVHAVSPGQVVRFGIKESDVVILSTQNKSPELKSSMSLRSAIDSAVEHRTDGHEQIAISLSGGVDSSIVSIHLKNSGKRITAFSSFWGDSDKSKYNQDAMYAEKIAERLDINHVRVEMPKVKEIEEYLILYLEAMQEPNANPTGISLYALYQEIASQGFRLVLTGDGSDEIFAGYQRYADLQKIPSFSRSNSTVLRRSLINYHGRLGRAFSRIALSFVNQDVPETWFYWHGIFSQNELKSLYSKSYEIDRFETAVLERISDLCQTDSFHDPVSKLMARDHSIWLDMESNRKLDRISMHFSIEARSPFQDERVVSMARTEREEIVKDSGTKKMLWDLYPELETLGIRKDKEGFISPVGHWLRGNQQLVDDSLKFLIAQRVFVPSFLDTFKNAAFEKDFRRIKQLWHLVVWAKWAQIHHSTGVA